MFNPIDYKNQIIKKLKEYDHNLDYKCLFMCLFFLYFNISETELFLGKYIFFSDFTFFRDYLKKITEKEIYIYTKDSAVPKHLKKYIYFLIKECFIEEKIHNDEPHFRLNEENILKSNIDRVFDIVFTKTQIWRMSEICGVLKDKYDNNPQKLIEDTEIYALNSFNKRLGEEVHIEVAFFIDLLEFSSEEEDVERSRRINTCIEKHFHS